MRARSQSAKMACGSGAGGAGVSATVTGRAAGGGGAGSTATGWTAAVVTILSELHDASARLATHPSDTKRFLSTLIQHGPRRERLQTFSCSFDKPDSNYSFRGRGERPPLPSSSPPDSLVGATAGGRLAFWHPRLQPSEPGGGLGPGFGQAPAAKGRPGLFESALQIA